MEFNAAAEHNPPFSYATVIQGELFWNSDESWEAIECRSRLRFSMNEEIEGQQL